MHEHNECEHTLKYCQKCDVVYCTKCKHEWGGHSCYYPYYPYYSPTITQPWITWTTSCEPTTDTAFAISACNHTS